MNLLYDNKYDIKKYNQFQFNGGHNFKLRYEL